MGTRLAAENPDRAQVAAMGAALSIGTLPDARAAIQHIAASVSADDLADLAAFALRLAGMRVPGVVLDAAAVAAEAAVAHWRGIVELQAPGVDVVGVEIR